LPTGKKRFIHNSFASHVQSYLGGKKIVEIKISELKPNPFKKNVNGGKLNEEQIEKIQSNLKELGLMGSLPVFKRDDKFYLISGHHRVEALKRQFGKDYKVKVEVHDYSDEQILRGMVVENLSQRIDDFREELDNIVLIKDYLENKICSLNERISKTKPFEPSSVRTIAAWLNQQGKEVMSIGKITQLLRIHRELTPEVLELVEKHKAGSKAEGLTPAEATALSNLPKEEQMPIAKALMNSEEGNKIDRLKALTEYKQADEETKEQVREGKLKLEHIGERMANIYNHKAINLVVEMQTLRKALVQFRKEKLFENFTSQEKTIYKNRLTKIKYEYTELMKQLDSTLEVL
jgi:ParB-like chromosome segregation protein Spo0J